MSDWRVLKDVFERQGRILQLALSLTSASSRRMTGVLVGAEGFGSWA